MADTEIAVAIARRILCPHAREVAAATLLFNPAERRERFLNPRIDRDTKEGLSPQSFLEDGLSTSSTRGKDLIVPKSPNARHREVFDPPHTPMRSDSLPLAKAPVAT